MWRAGSGDKIAFIDPDRSLTYGDLQARSMRFANALRALGLRREERVALLLHDTVDYPVAFWGAIRAGNVALPLNTFLNVSQYAYILADSRASALVAAAPLAQAIWPIIDRLPYLRTIILVGAIADDLAAFPGRDVHLFEDVIAQASAAPFTADTSVGRSRVLDVHLRLDRRSERRQARPFQPDGDGQAVRPGRARHHRAATWCIRRRNCFSPMGSAMP